MLTCACYVHLTLLVEHACSQVTAFYSAQGARDANTPMAFYEYVISVDVKNPAAGQVAPRILMSAADTSICPALLLGYGLIPPAWTRVASARSRAHVSPCYLAVL